MKKFMTVLSFLSLSLVSSAAAFAGDNGIKITFDKACRMGNAVISDGDIEFINLNLNLDAQQTIQTKKCEINAWFPPRKGYKLVVSTFKVEALAAIKENGGAALITLRHSFRDRDWRQDQDQAVKVGNEDLVVEQTAVGDSRCEEDAMLKTEILTSAFKANLIQDSATDLIKIKYSYQKCW